MPNKSVLPPHNAATEPMRSSQELSTLERRPPRENDDPYAADREDTEEDSDDEMWDWDSRPKMMSRPSEGRSAEPLLADDAEVEGGLGRGRSSYEGVAGEAEIRERDRRRHEMRSRSPTNTLARSGTLSNAPRKGLLEGNGAMARLDEQEG